MKEAELERIIEKTEFGEDELFLLMTYLASFQFGGSYHDEHGSRWSCHVDDNGDVKAS